jgi:hypothetical protein
MKDIRSRLATITLLLGSGLLSAQAIPVFGGGSALAVAVQNAPSGAVLVVSPATYDGFSMPLTKDVTIVAPTGATVVGTIAFPTGSPQFTVRLKGLAILPTPPFINDGGVESIGSLHLEDTTCRGLRVPSNPVRRSVYIRNCLIDFGALPHELWNVDAVLLDSTVYGSYCSQGLHVQGTLRAERSTMTTGGCAYGPTAGLSMDS